MNLQWYAIQVFTGNELTIKRQIEGLKEREYGERIGEIVVPVEELITVKNGEQKIVEKALYPAYCFAQLDLDTTMWQKIQSMPKVGKFIGEDKKPVALSKKDVEQILEKDRNRAKPRPKVQFTKGDQVRINEGSFANFTGTVEDFDFNTGILTLDVNIFGRSTNVELDYKTVELVEA